MLGTGLKSLKPLQSTPEQGINSSIFLESNCTASIDNFKTPVLPWTSSITFQIYITKVTQIPRAKHIYP